MRRREIRYAERGGEKVYGMSSVTAMKKHSGGVARYRAAEGKTVETPLRTGRGRHDDLYRRSPPKEVSKRTTFVRVSAQTNDVFGG